MISLKPCGHIYHEICWGKYHTKSHCAYCIDEVQETVYGKIDYNATFIPGTPQIKPKVKQKSTNVSDKAKQPSMSSSMFESPKFTNDDKVPSTSLKYVKQRVLTNERNNIIRRKAQNKQSEVMKERFSLFVPTTLVGDLVSICVPKRDRVPGLNLNMIAVVFKIHKRAKTIVAVTQYGIISKKGRSGEQNYNSFSPGDFVSLHQECHYPQLQKIRFMCIHNDVVGIEKLGKMTLREQVRLEYDRRDKSLLKTPVVVKKKMGCVCKNGNCSKRCGCKKAGKECGRNCGCKGMCDNVAD